MTVITDILTGIVLIWWFVFAAAMATFVVLTIIEELPRAVLKLKQTWEILRNEQ